VEPVKRETKAEKKEKREKEKVEKKRLAMEAAAAAGVDITKKGVAAAWGVGTKKGGKKAAAAAAAAVRLAEGDDDMENYDDIDSEAEVDALVHSVRTAQSKGVIGVPLAIPCDASSWFVARRERLRNCRDLLANALAPAPNRNGIATNVAPGIRMG
jgi:SAGA-associated factor 73